MLHPSIFFSSMRPCLKMMCEPRRSVLLVYCIIYFCHWCILLSTSAVRTESDWRAYLSRKGYQQRQFSLSGHRGRAIHRDNHIARSPPPDYHIFCFIGFVLFIWACLQLPSLNYPFNLLLLCLPSVTSLISSFPLFPFRPKNDKIKKVPGDGMPGRR